MLLVRRSHSIKLIFQFCGVNKCKTKKTVRRYKKPGTAQNGFAAIISILYLFERLSQEKQIKFTCYHLLAKVYAIIFEENHRLSKTKTTSLNLKRRDYSKFKTLLVEDNKWWIFIGKAVLRQLTQLYMEWIFPNFKTISHEICTEISALIIQQLKTKQTQNVSRR